MEKDSDYYRRLDLPSLAKAVPRDESARARAEAYHEMLTALALRCVSEQFDASNLLAYLGNPDRVTPINDGEVWEYSWSDEHCSHVYRSTTPFLVQQGRVVGIQRKAATAVAD
jgi:hypothetical protein